MALKIVNTESLDAVANAINAKAGTSGALQFPDGFVEAIGAIQAGGGITPEGEMAITYNGTYDVTNYASAKVEVVEKLPNQKLSSLLLNYPRELHIVPEDLENVSNTLRDGAFYKSGTLTSITVPGGINQIGSECFSYCDKLKSVVFESGSTQLRFGTEAFYNCASLSVFVVPDKVTAIIVGDRAFYGTGFTKLDMSKLSSTSGDNNFAYMKSLKEFIWSDTAKTIPSYAFSNNVAMDWIDTKSATSIGNSAFNRCSFTEAHVSGKVTTLGTYVFSYCSNLHTVSIHDAVTSMGSSVFTQCTSLVSVNIPRGITTLPNSTFYGCTSLPSVQIPSNITKIGSQAFQGCTSLEYIDLTDFGTDKTFPTLSSTNVFTNCGTSTASGTFEIRVKANGGANKARLAGMTNWSAYSDNIVEV